MDPPRRVVRDELSPDITGPLFEEFAELLLSFRRTFEEQVAVV